MLPRLGWITNRLTPRSQGRRLAAVQPERYLRAMFDIEAIPAGAQHKFLLGPLTLVVRRAREGVPMLLLSLKHDDAHDPKPSDIEHLSFVLPLPGEDPLEHDYAPHLTRRNRKNRISLGPCIGKDIVRFIDAMNMEIFQLFMQHTSLVTLEQLSEAGYSLLLFDDPRVDEFIAAHVPSGGLRELHTLRDPMLDLVDDSIRTPMELSGREPPKRGAMVITPGWEIVGVVAHYDRGLPCNDWEAGWYLSLRQGLLDRDAMREMFERVGGPAVMRALKRVGDWVADRVP
jgi:hypothetical protein